MRRASSAFLVDWKKRKGRKPLIIRGAKQTGKTWLMKEFGKEYYKQVAYVNFEASQSLKGLFSDSFEIKRILTAIQIETGVVVQSSNTLIIFDEIQEAPGGLTSLKYFQENAPEYDVIAAGSLLGVALTQHVSFPVGKVEFLDLHPLSFIEFLDAVGDRLLVELIAQQDWQLISSFKGRVTERLKQYYYVGGMPEAVLAFSLRADFGEVREIQKRILIAYEQDFSKHAPIEIVPRIRMLWNSIPTQLANENKKFMYGIIRRGARAKDYEIAMSWLIDCGLIHKINVTEPAMPLKAYEDFASFKLYLLDVGLLSAMTDLDVRTLLVGNVAFDEFKIALTEQYVLQQLIAILPKSNIYYWSPEGLRSEIDFLIQVNGKVIPIEVKAAENLKAKSLKVYRDKYNPELSIRTSMSDFREEESLINLPLYGISTILEITKPRQE